MSTPSLPPINELASLVGQDAQFNAFVDRHPYQLNDASNDYERWVDFATQHILTRAQISPDTIGDEVSIAMHSGTAAYARFLGGGSWSMDNKDQFALKEVEFLTHLLDKLSAINAKTPSNLNACYGNTLLFWTQHDQKHVNTLWLTMEQHGYPIQPQGAGFHHVWSQLICHGYVIEAQWLIDKGLLPTGSGSIEDNIFYWVKNKQNFAVVSLIPHDHLKTFVAAANHKGETPLHHAARQLMPPLVELLLTLGADANATTTKGLYPADMIKRSKSRAEHVGAVLELLGKQSSKTADELFIQACKSKDLTMAMMAIDKGLDVAQLCANTPKMGSFLFDRLPRLGMKKTRERQLAFLELLLNHNADLHHSDGSNALHAAINAGAVQCVELLLARAPHLADQRNQQGLRPAQMPTTQMELETGSTMYISQEQETLLLAKTQIKMLNLFWKHDISIEHGDFPTGRNDPQYAEHMAKVTRKILMSEIGDSGQERTRKKM